MSAMKKRRLKLKVGKHSAAVHRAETERMMKRAVKAMAKKITWWAAAEIIEVTDRTMRRWRELRLAWEQSR